MLPGTGSPRMGWRHPISTTSSSGIRQSGARPGYPATMSSSTASSSPSKLPRKSFSGETTTTASSMASMGSFSSTPKSVMRISASVDDLHQSSITMPVPIRPVQSAEELAKVSAGRGGIPSVSPMASPQSSKSAYAKNSFGENSGESPRSASSARRRLSILAGGGNNTNNGETLLSNSPKLGSSLLQKFSSFRFPKSESRDALACASPAASPPSPLGFHHLRGSGEHELDADGDSISSSSPPRAVIGPPARLEHAMHADSQFRHDLVDLLLAEHHAECTKKLRFIMAVLEYQRATDKRDRIIKGKKIVEIFLMKLSVFQVVGDIPAEVLEPFHFLSSSSGSIPSSVTVKALDKLLFTVKNLLLRQVTVTADTLRKQSRMAASLLDPIFVKSPSMTEMVMSEGEADDEEAELEDHRIPTEEEEGDDDDEVFGVDSRFVM